MKRSLVSSKKVFGIFAICWVCVMACVEFFHVASGTGEAIGQFSTRWFIFFVLFVFICLAIFKVAFSFLFNDDKIIAILEKVIQYRNQLNLLRWLFIVVVFLFPVWFLQYTMWGVVFDGIYFRLLLWGVSIFFLAIFITNNHELISWKSFLASLLLMSSAFTIAVSLRGVTDYPFSMAWSEGNRMWDYSVLFGRSRYNIADNQDIYVLLDSGRMLVGGLPFLIPNVTIEVVRLWSGLTLIFPYFLVGLAAYLVADKNIKIWLLIALWVFLFLRQGPIHSPLVLTAALTVFLWRKPLWFAIPLIIYAGYFAQSSRFTWLFAPGMWIGMLELAGASLLNGKLSRDTWIRAITLSISGAFGGYLLPKILPVLNQTTSISEFNEVSEQIANTGVSSEFVAYAITDQPLLWYRLLPNPTYGTGILLGLVIAVLPITIVMIWLATSKTWKINSLQILAIITPLIAFLAVGLVASTKIGGGGDLHNMDMFLIGVAFATFIAWVNGGKDVILKNEIPTWVRLSLITSLIIPAVIPWIQLRSYNYGDETNALLVLTDTRSKKDLDMLPDTATVENALQTIQDEANFAKEYGDILFIDQRQLLTFGYITDVTLIPEYEKKVLMNEALSNNIKYFKVFYNDIINQRFSLIVTEPLRTPIKDSTFEFGEENNAWVESVSIPVLCYYEEIEFLREVNVQLLVPKDVPDDCSAYLP